MKSASTLHTDEANIPEPSATEEFHTEKYNENQKAVLPLVYDKKF